MRYILSIFLLFVSLTDPITRISKVNNLKKDAKEAMEQKEYVKAVLHYIDLVDSMQIEDDNLKMNMASAAFHLSYGKVSSELKSTTDQEAPVQLDTAGTSDTSLDLKFAVIAENKYLELVDSQNKAIASNAYNQRGIITYFQSQKEEPKSTSRDDMFEASLEHFKNAMRKNPLNASARYNYELLKKLKILEEQQDDDDQKPSEYAKMMKKLSDEQRKQGRFKEAFNTMVEAMENDKTTAAYQEYITKLKVIASI